MANRIVSVSDLDIEIRDLVSCNYSLDQILQTLNQRYGIQFSPDKMRDYVNGIFFEELFEQEY